jgi:ATP-dependent DNA helicase RecG
MGYSASELFELLNKQDECPWIEAKGGGQSSHSVMETVCSFSNEPGLGGGYILMGVESDESSLFPRYKVQGITDPDKFQKDLATQCAGMFNLPIRPEVSVESIKGKIVIKVWINELSSRQKPVFFKSEGLPSGAFRRIGSTDQHCTEDDMQIFYQDSTSYDQIPVKGTSISQVDENALKRYRTLREKVNPSAEELTFDDAELIQSLGCVNKEKPEELNLAGLLLFGTSSAQRSNVPMLRVDYIRVPGNQWVENPDNRFATIDMRGPLLLLLYRLIDAINSDLPKGFLLAEDDLQATLTGLPVKALREAIVNALMHRSYREHQPTQVIRYDNRIEIINPGYSLKSEERLGQPGSETRNPFIAAVFHDTSLAETKGSGIRAMRRMMESAHLAPPTFESSRENNHFIARLLLHNFLDEKDLKWLGQFGSLNLGDSQKQALIFVREVGAIDNRTYRQMADCDTLKASNDLRILKDSNLLTSKGRGKSTYYVPGASLSTQVEKVNTEPPAFSTEPVTYNGRPVTFSGEPVTFGSLPYGTVTEKGQLPTTQDDVFDMTDLMNELSADLAQRINELGERVNDPIVIESIIKDLCVIRPYKVVEIAILLKKGENYISRKYLKPMIHSGVLSFLYPEMINHPDQAYISTTLT